MLGSTPFITTQPNTVFTGNTPTLDCCVATPETHKKSVDIGETKTPATPLYRRCINLSIAIFAVTGTLHCALIAAPVVGLGGGLMAIMLIAAGMPVMAPACGPAAELLGIIVVVVFSGGALAGIGVTCFYTPYCMVWVYDKVMNKLESDYQSSGFVQKVLHAYEGGKTEQPADPAEALPQ